MAGRVLLDTNVIIAFFSGEKAVSQRFLDAEVFVSSTVLGELYYGARKSAHVAEQFASSVQEHPPNARGRATRQRRLCHAAP